jgi:hypothetical protein
VSEGLAIGAGASSTVIKVTINIDEVLRPVPWDYRSNVLRMVEDCEAVFGGRDTELADLDNFLEENEQPCALLLAPTGRGKTALLIHWIARVQAAGRWTVVFGPISLRFQTATEAATLGALVYSLAAFHGETERLRTYSNRPDQLRPLIAEYLRREPPAGSRLLLVLDGLDEAVGWRVDRTLFPRTLRPHIKIIAAARQMARRSRSDWLDELGWNAKQTRALKLRPLSRGAVAAILRRMGNPLDAPATPALGRSTPRR